MALTWDLTKIKDYEDLCWIKNDDDTVKLNSATESLIWLTMAVGINSITESNADEFYCRVSAHEKLNGSMRSIWYDDDRPTERVFVTPEEVYSHIGLRTNASPLTATKFRKDMFDHSSGDSKRIFRNYISSLESENVDA